MSPKYRLRLKRPEKLRRQSSMKNWNLEAIRSAAARGLQVKVNDGQTLDDVLQPESSSKFRNCATVIDGIRFASKLEGTRYLQLKMLKSGGVIKNFKIQVTYRLDVNGIHICDYRADFVVENSDGTVTVEDTKGFITPEFKLKKKLMLVIHGIEIQLITATSNNNNNGKQKNTHHRQRRIR